MANATDIGSTDALERTATHRNRAIEQHEPAALAYGSAADPGAAANAMRIGTIEPPPRDWIGAKLFADEDKLIAGYLERLILSDGARDRIMRKARELSDVAAAEKRGLAGLDRALGTSPEAVMECLAIVRKTADIADQKAREDVIGEHLAALDATRQHVRKALQPAAIKLARLVIANTFVAGGTVPAALSRIAADLGMKQPGWHMPPVEIAAVGDDDGGRSADVNASANVQQAAPRTAPATQPLSVPPLRCSLSLALPPARSMDDAARAVAAYGALIDDVARAAGPPMRTHAGALLTRPAVLIDPATLVPYFHDRDIASASLSTILRDHVLPLAVAGASRSVVVLIDGVHEAALDITLAAFADTFVAPELQKTTAWGGFGLTVSAQSKRALVTARWLRALALEADRRIPVRLIAAASDWKAEMAQAADAGWPSSPVIAAPANQRIAMLALSRLLTADADAFHAIIATRDPVVLAALREVAPSVPRDIERPLSVLPEMTSRAAETSEGTTGLRIHAILGHGVQALTAAIQPHEIRGPGGLPSLLADNAAASDAATFLALVDPQTPQADTSADGDVTQDASPTPAADPVAQPANTGRIDLRPAAFARQPLFETGIAAPFCAKVADLIAQGFSDEPVATADDALLDDGTGETRYGPASIDVPIGVVTRLGLAEARAALDVSAEAASEWGQRALSARIACIGAAASHLLGKRAEATARLVAEAGLTLRDAVDEIDAGVAALKWIAGHAELALSAGAANRDSRGLVQAWAHRPRGLFLALPPAQRPLQTAIAQAASALVAGNAVVLVPPPQTPLICAFVRDVLIAAGIPGEVVQSVCVEPSTARRLVCASPVAGVVVEGPRMWAETLLRDLTADGRIMQPFIATSPGRHVAVVDASADLAVTVDALVASLRHECGQTWASPTCVLAAGSISEDLQRRLAESVAGLTIGDPSHPATQLGPLIDQEAADIFMAQKMRLMRTADVLYDGELPSAAARGAFAAPAVYAVNDAQALCEVAGPLLAIATLPDHALIDAAHDPHPLLAAASVVSVFTRRQRAVSTVCAVGQAAEINVNRCRPGITPSWAPSGTNSETASAFAFGGDCWLAQFSRRVRTVDGLALLSNVPT